MYSGESEVIDWKHPEIVALAATLAKDSRSVVDTAKNCFEWVRDKFSAEFYVIDCSPMLFLIIFTSEFHAVPGGCRVQRFFEMKTQQHI